MKIYVGFIAYQDASARYLAEFLPALRATLNASGADWKILAVDNSPQVNNPNQPWLESETAQGDFKLLFSGANLGFSRAYNLMFAEALKDGADYFLVINPDTVPAPDLVKLLAAHLEADEKNAAACPRILVWDFQNKKFTRIIDSEGVGLTAGHSFFDRHQGHTAGTEEFCEVFGFSGAGVLLRLSALQDICYVEKEKREYFDGLMFMYKEDVDLSYRLRLAGWKICFEPAAEMWHDRSVRPYGPGLLGNLKARKYKNSQVKRWSFLNHQIIMAKIEKLPFSLNIRWKIFWRQVLIYIFTSAFEPYFLSDSIRLRRLRPEIRARRKQLKIRVKIEEIEKFLD